MLSKFSDSQALRGFAGIDLSVAAAPVFLQQWYGLADEALEDALYE